MQKQKEAHLQDERVLLQKLDYWGENIGELKNTTHCMDELTIYLKHLRDNLPSNEWHETISACRSHFLKELVDQDPFTHWSFYKPRGYSGDAELLDFIYQEDSALSKIQKASFVGKAIFARNRMVPSCCSVRHRRDLVASIIDEICFSKPEVRILSVASGHLREAKLSAAVLNGNLSELIAIDQDPVSLKEIEFNYCDCNIVPKNVSIKQVLKGKFNENGFDFIYAAGLYDYLSDRVAQRLNQILFSKLSSGGRLLIANFSESTADAGYMEAYMNWFLTFRNVESFKSTTDLIERDLIQNIRTFQDSTGTVIYVEITKK